MLCGSVHMSVWRSTPCFAADSLKGRGCGQKSSHVVFQGESRGKGVGLLLYAKDDNGFGASGFSARKEKALTENVELCSDRVSRTALILFLHRAIGYRGCKMAADRLEEEEVVQCCARR